MTLYSTFTIFSNTIFHRPAIFYRYIRNISKRGDPKLIKGTVRSSDALEGEDFSRISSYDDFIKTVKSAVNCNELAIEKALTSEDDFASALPKVGRLDDKIRTDDHHKNIIKNAIISKKYFKMDLETNLLTHAAKEQIRYLYKTNPEEWTPETLSKSFPISINGVKKLLKSNYILRTPERIKKHDEEVEERWKALESGRASDLISPFTQRMWDEGKITKQNYKSNLNFPTPPSGDNKTILVENKTTTGEYSAIIKQYVNYKKESESSNIKSNVADELLVRDEKINTLKNKNENQFKFNKFKYYIDDETNYSDETNHSNKYRKAKHTDEFAVSHSQFKINLRNEKNSKEFTMNPKNLKWIEDQGMIKNPTVSENPTNSAEMFTKISKYQKKTHLSNELKGDVSESEKSHGKNLRYQHSKGKIIKDRIDLPPNSNKKNSLYKVGQCVYDKNGEFLYKIPFHK